MRKLIIKNEMLNDYYESRFHDDLIDYFEIIKNSNGIDVANGIHLSSDIFCHTSAETQVMFIGLVSFMLSAEEELMWKVSSDQSHKLYECLNSFGFPVVPVATRRYGLGSMLEFCKIDCRLFIVEEILALREAMMFVKPYMFNKFLSHLKTWNNGFFSNLVSEEIKEDISHVIIEGIQSIHSKKYKYQGLTGLEITHRDFDEYYRHHFYSQFKRYFSCAQDKGTYLLVLHVYDQGNMRWADEMPGRNIKENLLFASIVLYMVMAEQSILEHAPSAHKDFHQCFGWPMIYSGPGAGPYLHPLKMLEYAGISPKKYETPLFLEVVRKVFYYLRQDMNTLLNVRQSVIKDPIAGKRFFEIVTGHTKSRIRKYLDRQENSVQELLAKWTTSPEDCWYKILESEGIPIMMEIKQS